MKYLPDNYNEMSFETNNGEKLVLVQDPAENETVYIMRGLPNGLLVSSTYKKKIPAEKFVMLLNLYNYIMDNDIQNDFINPNGSTTDHL